MKKNKINLYSALAGIVGYFLGTIFYELFFSPWFGDRLILKVVVVIFTAIIVGVFSHFYLKKKYPNLKKELTTLEKDERGQLIRGKTSTYTLVFTAILAIIIFSYTYLNNQMIVSYLIAGSYILTLAFNIGINFYLQKRI